MKIIHYLERGDWKRVIWRIIWTFECLYVYYRTIGIDISETFEKSILFSSYFIREYQNIQFQSQIQSKPRDGKSPYFFVLFSRNSVWNKYLIWLKSCEVGIWWKITAFRKQSIFYHPLLWIWAKIQFKNTISTYTKCLQNTNYTSIILFSVVYYGHEAVWFQG